jgi:hypothetical protein
MGKGFVVRFPKIPPFACLSRRFCRWPIILLATNHTKSPTDLWLTYSAYEDSSALCPIDTHHGQFASQFEEPPPVV